MAIIPQQYKDATTVIGVRDISGKPIWLATGFMVGRYEGIDSKGEERYSVYLITNKHVVRDLSDIELQYNLNNNAANVNLKLLNGKTKLYSEHPQSDIDVVAINVNISQAVQNGINITFFSLKDNILSLADMKSTGVCDGTFTYVLGFPVGIDSKLVDNILKDPICRLGCIAKIEHLYHPANKDNKYFVDSKVFPGNSGGPVINRPEVVSINGTTSNSTSMLIGIVSAYLPYREVLYSRQTQIGRMITEENSGLTIVFPVDSIKDVVEIERTRSTGLQSNQNMQLP